MRESVVAIMLGWVLLSPTLAAEETKTAAKVQVAPPDMSVLPEQLERRYLDLQSFSMRVAIFRSGKDPAGKDYPEENSSVVHFACAKGDKHRSDAYIKGKWRWRRVSDGKRFSEVDDAGRTFVGKLPMGGRSRAIRVTEDCSFGSYLAGWNDDTSRAPLHFSKILRNSSYKGVEDVDGHPCWVFKMEDEFSAQTVFVCTKEMLVRRWIGEQFIQRDENGKVTAWIRRDRRFSELELNKMPPEAFTVLDVPIPPSRTVQDLEGGDVPQK